MKKLYAVQGIIFQKEYYRGFGNKLEIGTVTKVHDGVISSLFHGTISSSEDNENVFCGEMNDRWGDSKITDFKINDKELSFTKFYKNRPPIYYVFTEKKGETWIGGYEGKDCGTGTAKCIVCPIDESYFDS